MKVALAILAVALLSCVCSRQSTDSGTVDPVARDVAAGFQLDEARVMADLQEIAKAPHPFGSTRQQELAAWLATRATEAELQVTREAFSSDTPNPAAGGSGPVSDTVAKDGVNLYAMATIKPGAPCVVLLASHYDSKIVDGIDYLGANDSGSSSAILLHILRHLKAQQSKIDVTCDVGGVWFDGEEAVLPNWSDGEQRHPAKIQDNTYGSRHGAGRLTSCDFEGKAMRCLPQDLGGKPVAALILLDMVGSPNLLLSREGNSTSALLDLATRGSSALSLKNRIAADSTLIDDDHIPYLNARVPALDLIDFNHLDYWHAPGDEVAQVSPESLNIAAKIAIYTAIGAAREPKVFAP